MAWYYAGPESTPVGPLTSEELRARAAAGSVTPDTYIIEHAEGATLAWRRYRDVFPAAEPAAAVPRPTTHSVRLTVPSAGATPAAAEPSAAVETAPALAPEPEPSRPPPVDSQAAAPASVEPETTQPTVPPVAHSPVAVTSAEPAAEEREPAPTPASAPPAMSAASPSSVGAEAPATSVAPPRREVAPEPAPVAAKPERGTLLPAGTPTSGPVPAVQPAMSSAMTVQAPLVQTLKPMPYPLRPTNGWCAWGFGLGLAGFCLSLICGIGVALAVPSLVLSAIGLVQVMRNRQQHGQALAVAGLALSTLGVGVAIAYFMWLAVPVIRAHGLTVTEQTSNDSE